MANFYDILRKIAVFVLILQLIDKQFHLQDEFRVWTIA
jgi:hypothetical protein